MVSSPGILQPRPDGSPSAQSGKKAMGSLGSPQTDLSVEGDRRPFFHPVSFGIVLVSLVAGPFTPAHGSGLVQIPNPGSFPTTPREISFPDGTGPKTPGIAIGKIPAVPVPLLTSHLPPLVYEETRPGNNNSGRWTVHGKSLSLPRLRHQSQPV